MTNLVEDLARTAAEHLVRAMGTGDWPDVRDRYARVIGPDPRLDDANAQVPVAARERAGWQARQTTAWQVRIADLLAARPDLATPLHAALGERGTRSSRADARLDSRDIITIEHGTDIRIDKRQSIRQWTINIVKGHPIVSVVVALALVGSAGTTAIVLPNLNEEARISLSPAQVQQGADYTVGGGGFEGGETVRISEDERSHVIGDAVADAAGNITGFQVHEAPQADPRTYVIMGYGVHSGRHGSATLRVVPAVVVAETRGSWSGGRGGLTLTVTRLARWSNGVLQVGFTVGNHNAQTVELPVAELTATTGSGNLTLLERNPGTSWPDTVGGGGKASGSAAFAAVAGPGRISLSFPQGVMTFDGFYELAVRDVPFP